MKDCIWITYHYNLLLGGWGITIRMEAGYGALSSSFKDEAVNLQNGVFFCSKLQPYPESQPLLQPELNSFCNGLRFVSKEISERSPCLPETLIILRSIQFSDCNIQEDAFTAAASEWAGAAFAFQPPDYAVSFDKSKGRYGMYQFDFTKKSRNISRKMN